MISTVDLSVAVVRPLDDVDRATSTEEEEHAGRDGQQRGHAQGEHTDACPAVSGSRPAVTDRCSYHYTQPRRSGHYIQGIGRRLNEADLLATAVDAVREGGLTELTFGRLAARAGTSDRMLVYYFIDKHHLVERVVQALATELLGHLDQAFGPTPRSPRALLRRAWPVLIREPAHRTLAVWLELAGRAAAGHQPERALATDLVTSMLDWLATRVDGPTAAARRAQAAQVAAALDGALLLHHLGREDAARAAIR